MSARTTNFGISQRERARRVAGLLDDPYDVTGVSAISDPAGNAFYGSLRELGQRAADNGMSFRADIGSIGRLGLPTEGGGRLTDTDRAGIAGNIALGQMADEQAAQQLAVKAALDQRDAANRADMHKTYDEQVLASTTGPAAPESVVKDVGPNGEPRYTVRPQGTERERFLSMLPGPVRAQYEKQFAAEDLAKAAQSETVRHNQAAEETARVTAGESADNVKDAVAGMKEGTLPPILPGRATKDYVKLLAEARAQGYDLAGAATDWTATQKHIASLNSTQQLRLNEAINQLPELLDSVDSLASQWKANGKLPLLNKANIMLAKNGAMGAEAASIANRLSTQIADVNADLGTVYMGGNSPTDHALKLASTALNENWDEKVLHDLVNQARSNVKIRQNSIRNTGVAGASPNNPYAPPVASAPASPAAPAAGGAHPKGSDPGGIR